MESLPYLRIPGKAVINVWQRHCWVHKGADPAALQPLGCDTVQFDTGRRGADSEAAVIVVAIVWQPVRRRTLVYPDRPPRNLAIAAAFRMGNISHSHHRPAGIYIHDVDHRVPVAGL